jgi:hypothetical protein
MTQRDVGVLVRGRAELQLNVVAVLEFPAGSLENVNLPTAAKAAWPGPQITAAEVGCPKNP